MALMLTWQTRLGAPGARVEGYDELEQSLRIVMGTPLGSVPGRPDFGTRFHEYFDAPFSVFRPKVSAEAFRAARAHWTRGELRAANVLPAIAEEGRFRLELKWQPATPLDAASDAVERTTFMDF